MKTKAGVARAGLVTAAVASLLGIGAAQADDNSTRHEAQAMEKAKISLSQAVRAAEKQNGGQAVSAEYELKRGNPAYYEVKVLSADGQKLTEYELDPNTGQVTKTSDEKFEKLFTRLKPTAIQNAPTSLTRAIATAEARGGGKASEASISRDGDQVQYNVEIAKVDGTTEKFKINGSDGKVASAK
jgi:uncharacterized membrane protein YkoI